MTLPEALNRIAQLEARVASLAADLERTCEERDTARGALAQQVKLREDLTAALEAVDAEDKRLTKQGGGSGTFLLAFERHVLTAYRAARDGGAA